MLRDGLGEEPDAWAKLYGRRGGEPLTELEKRIVGPDDRKWLRQVRRPDLSRMHHALFMLTTHPMTSDEEKRELEDLGDACWNEGIRRNEGPK